MKKIIAVLFVSASLLGVFTPAVHAQTIASQYEEIQNEGLIFAGICSGTRKVCTTEDGVETCRLDQDACPCRDKGDCTLDDMLQLLVNLSVFIFGISGSIMLLIFVYGGMMWILAHGDSAMVEKGKKAIIGGLVGLVIILGSYAAINVIVSVLKTGEIPTTELEDTIGGDAEDIIDTQ